MAIEYSNVEILSDKSVQLTWTNDGNENKYVIEKREPNATEWTKVTKVPLSQGLALLEDLDDAQQCQFRLVVAAKSGFNDFDIRISNNIFFWFR